MIMIPWLMMIGNMNLLTLPGKFIIIIRTPTHLRARACAFIFSLFSRPCALSLSSRKPEKNTFNDYKSLALSRKQSQLHFEVA
jgi:hypothetical protein